MDDGLSIRERADLVWNSIGSTKKEKVFNAFLYLSALALTAAIWNEGQKLNRFSNFSVVSQAVATGASVALLKSEEYLKGKSPKNSILNRYHFVPLLLGLLTVTCATNTWMASRAALTNGLTITQQGFIGQILTPAMSAAFAAFLLSTKTIDCATDPGEQQSDLWNSLGKTWNQKLKNSFKFSLGTAITLSAAWISSHRTIATAITIGGLAAAAAGLNYAFKPTKGPAGDQYLTEAGLSSILIGACTAGAFISGSFLIRNTIQGVAFNSLGHLSCSLLKLATLGGCLLVIGGAIKEYS